VAALADYTVEFTPQRREIGDLAVHFREVFTSNGINGLARAAAALIGKADQPADLRKGETETARSSDETPSHVVPAVGRSDGEWVMHVLVKVCACSSTLKARSW
jgi:hypothetical protein